MIKHLLFLPLLLINTPLRLQTDTVSSKISKIPYKHVDVLAKFPQGDFKSYISNNLKTNHTFEYSIKGQIILLMSIGPDGGISQVTVLKSLSPKIDPEVVRVVNASPKWQAATLNGQKVSMDMVLNIDIEINGSKKAVKPLTVIPATVAANISKPIYAMVKPVDPKVILPSVKREPVVAVKKTPPPTVKKAAPAAPLVVKTPPPPAPKKIEPPVIKKTPPLVAKKVELPIIKKPTVIVKKTEPPAIKKPAPVIAVKKVIPPIVKKPAPVIAVKKVIPPIVKKPTLIVAAKKIEKPIIKKAEPPVIKELAVAATPVQVKKRKRVVIKQDLFNPTADNASFIGGDKALAAYLGGNISYPEKARKANIEGRVVLSFVVEEDGTVDDVEVISSPSEDLSQEAIRVMLASPKWKPGKQNGIAVPISFIIPIKFTMAPKGN